jgi:predicted ABC-type transport system involved in lysophospholipase L1 biosynthesis ATPase subunit
MEISCQNDTARRYFRITNIGFIFQDFGLLDYLNVKDNILHPYRITRALKLNDDVQDRADMIAKQMGIDDKLNRHPTDLSHGERQHGTAPLKFRLCNKVSDRNRLQPVNINRKIPTSLEQNLSVDCFI